MSTLTRTKAHAATLAVALAMIAPQAAAACTCPSRTDAACITTARTGLGSPYEWGGACWSTSDRGWGGADCSGYVVKAWQVPRYSSIREQYHPYGTWPLFTDDDHWYAVGRSAASFADAVGYPDPDGSGSASGHVVLYYYGDPYGMALVFEAPRAGADIRYGWRDLSASKWRFRRRHNLYRTLYLV